MPSSSEILELLATMTHELAWVAIAWHVAIAAIALALLAGWRPSPRTGALLLVAPAVSVALAALAYGNPFNALAFGGLAVALALASGTAREISVVRPWAAALGGALIAFGWGYPHFVAGPWYRMIYAAPVGIVPCPTLAVLAGFVLIAGGFRSRAITAVLAVWTAFYAAFGMFRLGVVLDAGLGVAMVGLVAVSALPWRQARAA